MSTNSGTYVELPDGRTLEVTVVGPEDGDVLLYHHGTPGAGFPYGPMAHAAAARGLRTVAYSRPGYGTSTPQPGRRVVDAASDAARVLDATGAKTFRTVGWSGGGPHALACAAGLRDRCLCAATIAGLAPYPAEGLDWYAGMADENVEEFGLALRGADALRPFLETFALAVTTVTADDFAASMGGLLSEVDKAQVTANLAEYLLKSFRLGLSHGVEGQLDDDLAFVHDWGFSLASLGPVAIWQGAQDRMVPYGHGAWLADHIPRARRHLFNDQGHLSLAVESFEAILDDMLSV